MPLALWVRTIWFQLRGAREMTWPRKANKHDPIVEARNLRRSARAELLITEAILRNTEEMIREHEEFASKTHHITYSFVRILSRDQNNPPSGYVMSLLLPADTSEDVIANLEELFHESWVPRYGVTKARRIWRFQSFQIIGRRFIGMLLDFAERLKKLAS